LKMERDNMQEIFTLQHEFDVHEIAQLNAEIELETDKITRETLAMKSRSVRTIEADN